MKILLVEDDVKLGEATRALLAYKKCCVDWAQNGSDALAMVKSSLESSYDVVILDWMLPEISGLEICQLLRNKYLFQGGIIFVTAKGELDDCVQALDCGADDYLVKPFKIKELIARINAVCRRKTKPFVDKIYCKNGVTLNRDISSIFYNGQKLHLRKKEFALFELLFINLNNILPRASIFEKIWDDKLDTNRESLDSHIYSLRKSLKIFPLIKIKLVKNIGYKMEIEQ